MNGHLAERILAGWRSAVEGRSGACSLALYGLGGPVAALDADAAHYAASTIKVAVLAALLRARHTGSIDLADPVAVHADFASAERGRFTLTQSDDQDDATWAKAGDVMAVAVLAEAMITVSSNIATDLIIERIGLSSVADFLAEAGLGEDLRLHRLIGDTAAERAGLTNSVTADGLARLFVGLANASWLSTEDSASAIAMLARQTHTAGIPSGLPAEVWSASKGGWVPGVRHDVALVRPETAPPYVLAICTTSPRPDTEALRLIRELSRLTYQEWTR